VQTTQLVTPAVLNSSKLSPSKGGPHPHNQREALHVCGYKLHHLWQGDVCLAAASAQSLS